MDEDTLKNVVKFIIFCLFAYLVNLWGFRDKVVEPFFDYIKPQVKINTVNIPKLPAIDNTGNRTIGGTYYQGF